MQRLAFATFGVLLSACASLDQPMNPTEYREAFKKNGWATERFEAKRPYAQVSQVLRRKASECLNVTIHGSANAGRQRWRQIYKPSVVVGKDTTELAVQVGFGGSNENAFQKVPKDGYYILLADAVPSGKNSTTLTMYPGAMSEKMVSSIRGWASGDNMACPDLASARPGNPAAR